MKNAAPAKAAATTVAICPISMACSYIDNILSFWYSIINAEQVTHIRRAGIDRVDSGDIPPQRPAAGLGRQAGCGSRAQQRALASAGRHCAGRNISAGVVASAQHGAEPSGGAAHR